MKRILSVLLGLCPLLLYADTMWLVTPDFSHSRRMLTQHCGDAEAAVEYRRSGGGGFGVIRIGDRAFMNTRGVCIVAQEMVPHLDRENPGASSTGAELAASIVLKAPDAPAAVRALRRAVRGRELKGGWIFTVSDPRCAFAVECSPNRFDAEEIDAGYCVYSHTWRLPALFSVLHLDFERLWSNKARETVLARKLAECAESQGVSIIESAALARHDEVFGVHSIHLGPYGNASKCSVIFESDDEFPEVMSAIYVAAGSPRHTPHLPVALGVASQAEFPDATWRERAETLRRTAGNDPEFAEALRGLEQKLFEEFRQTRMTARHKLRRSGRREALRMLTELQKRQAAEIRRFMDEQIRKYSSRKGVTK